MRGQADSSGTPLGRIATCSLIEVKNRIALASSILTMAVMKRAKGILSSLRFAVRMGKRFVAVRQFRGRRAADQLDGCAQFVRSFRTVAWYQSELCFFASR